MRSRIFSSRTALSVIVLILSYTLACSADPSTGESPGSLVVYSGRSESLVGPLIDQFREATGVDVSVKYGSTAEIAATLLEEGANSPADLFFAQDPGGLGAVEGMLSELPADILATVPKWAGSPDGKWVGISGRARVVVYNTENVSESDLPRTIEGFTDPSWKGRIGWPPTNGSFQAMVTAMRVQWGEDRTRQWIEGIQANEPVAYSKNTPTVAAAGAGEVDVGFVNHYYLYRFLSEEGDGFSARNYYLPGGGPGSIVLVAGAGILETADSRDNAERFLRFMLSQVAQQYFASQTFEYPLVDGVTTHMFLTPLDAVNNPTSTWPTSPTSRGPRTCYGSSGSCSKGEVLPDRMVLHPDVAVLAIRDVRGLANHSLSNPPVGAPYPSSPHSRSRRCRRRSGVDRVRRLESYGRTPRHMSVGVVVAECRPACTTRHTLQISAVLHPIALCPAPSPVAEAASAHQST